MSNDRFRFKQFVVEQNAAAMKVGVDGVLLGAWAKVDHAYRILDVGTGTGLLALMTAQRMPEAMIDAVEIDDEACRQAQQNISNSSWPGRIRVICDDFRNFADHCTCRYDLIIANPPYFIDSLKSPTAKRNTARHSDSLPHSALLAGSVKLLTRDGILAIVLPPTEAQLLIDKARSYGMFVRRILNVCSLPSKPVRRMLIELSKAAVETTEHTLCIEKETREDYTEEYKNLTKEFYLKF